MRIVIFRDYIDGQWVNDIKGMFHQWGSAIVETSDSVHQYSVAIIEDETGKVHTVNPEHVTFLERTTI